MSDDEDDHSVPYEYKGTMMAKLSDDYALLKSTIPESDATATIVGRWHDIIKETLEDGVVLVLTKFEAHVRELIVN